MNVHIYEHSISLTLYQLDVKENPSLVSNKNQYCLKKNSKKLGLCSSKFPFFLLQINYFIKFKE